MRQDNYIKFLGTAGARFVVARQLRYSGGIFAHFKGKNIVIDPGPGTLVRLARSRPAIDVTTIDAIILTHIHIDHTNDVNVLIDGMTSGGFRKHGLLFAPDECLNGPDRVVLNYVRPFLERIEVLGPGKKYRIGDVTFSTSVRHRHPVETYGLLFDVGGNKVSFMADTQYFPELARCYKGSDILVMNVVFSTPLTGVMHLSLDDVRRIVPEIRPKQVILTHLGMTMLKARPRQTAQALTRELGIPIVAASDGMTVQIK